MKFLSITRSLTLFCLVFSIIFLGGCATTKKAEELPELKYSDIIFVMPMILDLRLSSSLGISGEALRENIEGSLEAVKGTLERELGRRGYHIVMSNIREEDLNAKDDSDMILKSALSHFRSLSPHNYKDFQDVLPGAFTDLFTRYENGKLFHRDMVHNVLFIQLESYIDKVNTGKNPDSKSILRIRSELVNIREADIIGYKQRSIRNKNIFNTPELEELLAGLVSSIPISAQKSKGVKIDIDPVLKSQLEKEAAKRVIEEKAAKEKAAKEKAEKERVAKEKAAKEKAVKEKAEEERLAKEKAAKEKAAKEKAEKEKIAKEKAAKVKAAREKAIKEKAARDKIAKEKAAQARAAREKVSKERKERKRSSRANSTKAAKEKAAKAKAANEKAAKDKAVGAKATVKKDVKVEEAKALVKELTIKKEMPAGK